MPAYSGKFQYLDPGGAALQQGPCEVSFDAETCVVTPASGAPLAFDLGDIDTFSPADWDVTLRLYTEKRVLLRQFGPAFGRMRDELLAAWRDRTVRCLLLEDLEEAGRFQCNVNGAPAEIRIYGSNIAVLPLGERPLQRRLADVEAVTFADSTYTTTMRSPAGNLNVSKLGPKSDEFRSTLDAVMGGLHRRSAEILHQTFPFLSPDALQRLIQLAPEGRSVKLGALSTIHPELPDALISRAVDERLKPYFDRLQRRALSDALMTGFKFIRPGSTESESAPASDDEEPAADALETAQETKAPLFFWFFFPLAGRDIAAWEATTGTGRATYFFRAVPPVEEVIARLTRGLALVNFRREPVYLPDASLDREARFHRYAIGRRKLPELSELRSAFIGRAIHSSPEAWEQQVASVAADSATSGG